MKEIGPKVLKVDGVPVFVVLRYDEYQRLLALASGSPTGGEEPTDEEVTNACSKDDLVTSTADLSELPSFGDEAQVQILHDGLIPHDVVVAAVHNHWSLVRAWREYLGLNQLTMAQRLGVSVEVYVSMESKFSQLPLPSKERLAGGLGIDVQQLVSGGRRRRNDHE